MTTPPTSLFVRSVVEYRLESLKLEPDTGWLS